MEGFAALAVVASRAMLAVTPASGVARVGVAEALAAPVHRNLRDGVEVGRHLLPVMVHTSISLNNIYLLPVMVHTFISANKHLQYFTAFVRNSPLMTETPSYTEDVASNGEMSGDEGAVFGQHFQYFTAFVWKTTHAKRGYLI